MSPSPDASSPLPPAESALALSAWESNRTLFSKLAHLMAERMLLPRSHGKDERQARLSADDPRRFAAKARLSDAMGLEADWSVAMARHMGGDSQALLALLEAGALVKLPDHCRHYNIPGLMYHGKPEQDFWAIAADPTSAQPLLAAIAASNTIASNLGGTTAPLSAFFLLRDPESVAARPRARANIQKAFKIIQSTGVLGEDLCGALAQAPNLAGLARAGVFEHPFWSAPFTQRPLGMSFTSFDSARHTGAGAFFVQIFQEVLGQSPSLDLACNLARLYRRFERDGALTAQSMGALLVEAMSAPLRPLDPAGALAFAQLAFDACPACLKDDPHLGAPLRAIFETAQLGALLPPMAPGPKTRSL